MLDQSFSPKNIQAIFDTENRKGVNLERRFKNTFSNSLAHILEQKNLRKSIRFEKNQQTKDQLIERLNNSSDEREEILKEIFDHISESIKKYKPIIKLSKVNKKTCYSFDNSVDSYFYSKIIQKNLKETYKIKSTSRYNIIKSLCHIVKDKFPKIIIRTDIKSFYESIPQSEILEILKNDNLISVNTYRCISKIIDEFNLINIPSKNGLGLPRGIGFSAYLSEIYMKLIDDKIKKLNNLIFYERYVDDIVAVFAPSSNKKNIDPNDFLQSIKNIISSCSNFHLEINDKKTFTYNLTENLDDLIWITYDQTIPAAPKEIYESKKGLDYLGYKIGFKNTLTTDNKSKIIPSTKLAVDILDKKCDKFKQRIKTIFNSYQKKHKHNPKRSFDLLIARLEYLLSNTQLSNNKSNVYVGLYYSQPFITENHKLKELDRSLNYYINKSTLDSKKKTILKNLSFSNAYYSKDFCKYSFSNKIYKNLNNKSKSSINLKNKGVIKFGLMEITSIWKYEK